MQKRGAAVKKIEYINWSDEHWDRPNSPIKFGLCGFHAAIIERIIPFSPSHAYRNVQFIFYILHHCTWLSGISVDPNLTVVIRFIFILLSQYNCEIHFLSLLTLFCNILVLIAFLILLLCDFIFSLDNFVKKFMPFLSICWKIWKSMVQSAMVLSFEPWVTRQLLS